MKTSKLGCKPISTSVDNKCKLNTENGESLQDSGQFQSTCWKLIYLMITQTRYLPLAVSQIYKFIHAPITPHLEIINRILRYLK